MLVRIKTIQILLCFHIILRIDRLAKKRGKVLNLERKVKEVKIMKALQPEKWLISLNKDCCDEIRFDLAFFSYEDYQ